MCAPPSVTAKDVERTIADKFGLRTGELAVLLHYPEAFLLKFKHRHHCEEAVKQASPRVGELKSTSFNGAA
ncbi:hypothetical protein OsJ_24445 [Oryza sativa Japonica Group]|uniref:Uncharacterized protein n=1 Tax=Oryza sativa subsp. japonica TaxID=39947 RepID=B9FXI0_ORYSJ|nr:hypothetical protein OsJ_24445 [Oryza sativa Japonica Group]